MERENERDREREGESSLYYILKQFIPLLCQPKYVLHYRHQQAVFSRYIYVYPKVL